MLLLVSESKLPPISAMQMTCYFLANSFLSLLTALACLVELLDSSPQITLGLCRKQEI